MTMPARQRGVALLIVLLILALSSVLAVEMGARLQMHVPRAANIKNNNQAYWYAMAAEGFARDQLATALGKQDGILNGKTQWYGEDEFRFPTPGGEVIIELLDSHTCFNLNALAVGDNQQAELQERQQAFHRLISQQQDWQVDGYELEVLRDSLTDWLDKDDRPSGTYGVEDAEYASKPRPYLAANQPMVDKSELRLVQGANPGWLYRLMPLVCAWPDSNALSLNINGLGEQQAPVLQALLGLGTLQGALDIIASRPPHGYDDIEAFLAQPEVAAQSLSDSRKQWFTVKPEYFLLRIRSHYNDADFTMTSLVKNNDNNRLTVIRRIFGGMQ